MTEKQLNAVGLLDKASFWDAQRPGERGIGHVKGVSSPKDFRLIKIVRRAGFTLIELLVVVSIIALLVSILLPALGRARDQAKKVVCATRMRSLDLASVMYATENEGRFPWYADTFPDGPTSTVYYNTLAPYLGGLDVDADEPAHGDTDTRNWHLEVRKCPAGKNDDIGWIGVHFAIYNVPGEPYTAPFVWRIPGQGPYAENQQVRFEKVKSPALWVTYIDSYDWGFYSPAWLKFQQDLDNDGIADSGYNSGKIYNWAEPKVHNNGCNIALFDGHVEYLKFEDFLRRQWGDQ